MQLDQVVDFLVGDLGVGYFKLDYNISIAPGPDSGGLSAGAGLLAANRAQLDWLDAVLDRHPALVIENCSSGGMRTDYAGRSLRVAARKIDDYAETAHMAEKILGGHSGHEGGDPAKVAAAILRIAGAEDAPVQLLLGADAVHYATQSRARFEEEFGRWVQLTLSTGFDT